MWEDESDWLLGSGGEDSKERQVEEGEDELKSEEPEDLAKVENQKVDVQVKAPAKKAKAKAKGKGKKRARSSSPVEESEDDTANAKPSKFNVFLFLPRLIRC